MCVFPPAVLSGLQLTELQVYITFCERLRIARTKGRHEVLRPDKEAVDRYMASFQRT